jgi:UDP-glucose 4-epimerase
VPGLPPGRHRETASPPPRFPGRQVPGLRVLVTGGSGFIGTRVVGELCQAGAQVMSVDRRPPQQRFPASCQAETCDIRAARLAALAAAFAPHVVVHLAAHVSVPESARRPAADADVNVRGTVTVAEAAAAAAAAAGAELLVFAASCAIYGPPARLPVGEDHPLAPVTPYGLSKAAALGYAEWFARHRRLPVTSLILGNVYGPARPARGDGGVIRQFLTAATDQRAPVLHGDGRATRDFVHVDDVADAVLRACAAPPAGRVNIGSGTETSIAEVQAMVSEAAGQAIPPARGDARPGDIQRMCLRIDRAAALLDWSPRTSLAEGIAALIPARLAP